MTNSQNLTPQERKGIRHIRESLGDWALRDIEDITPTHPRLAFVGISAWLDATTRIHSAPQELHLRKRIRRFAAAYAPKYTSHAGRLTVGTRNKLLHEYSTKGVALSEHRPDLHLTPTAEGLLILNIETLVADCRAAFVAFLAELETNAPLRTSAIKASAGLLAPTLYSPPLNVPGTANVAAAHALSANRLPTGT